MDPISLIVAAAGAGATAAVQESTNAAIKDAYASFKALLRRRLGRDAERVDAAALEAAGAAGDEELVAAARDLLGRYTVTVSGGKGVVVGDNATVQMNFGD